jgi:ABC-type tungstate transport system substrate-binding protein
MYKTIKKHTSEIVLALLVAAIVATVYEIRVFRDKAAVKQPERFDFDSVSPKMGQ